MGGGGELSGRARPERKRRDVNGRARAGEGVGGRDEGGAGVEGFEGLIIVLMPPPGVGGGSEQAGRTRPERKRRGDRTGAKWGKGWG